MEKEEYEAQIKALKEEIELLKKKQTYEIKRQKYGLNWIDVPEAFEKDSENKIPVLEEVKDKSIKNDDGKPTHILIEGDNYHALQCLNYTHKGKIDVIYIDPPYNTGNEFVYKDARYLDKYPDGSLVDSNHPLKHSYWLSFMEKRLKLAKNLLSDKGVIFISIDDCEQANLRLLCDSIYGEKNFITQICWQSLDTIKNDAKYFSDNHEYIFVYSKDKLKTKIQGIKKGEKQKAYYKNYDNDPRGAYLLTPLHAKSGTENNIYSFIFSNGQEWTPPAGTFPRFSVETLMKLDKENRLYLDPDCINVPQKKTYLSEVGDRMPPTSFWDYSQYGSTRQSNNELSTVIGKGHFQNPKPTKLITSLIDIIEANSNSTILDFFAGSGTTLHATMKLNEEDGGNRQCILVQLNENNICEEVTYERNRRVMQGYTNSKGEQIPGLGNSLKYYKTAFIGQNNCKNANDDDRTELAKKAGCLLSLGENTLDEIFSTEYYQLFTGSKEATAVYFTDDYEKFDEFKEKVAELAPKFKKTFVYIFAWSSADDFAYEFEDIPNIQIKAIPLPILEIYKSIYNA